MARRGRKSAASQSIATEKVDGRPHAPDDLTEAQQRIWTAVVGDEAADFFATAALQELLKAFVRHLDAAHRLARWIDEFDPRKDSLKDLDRLLRMHAREAKEAADRATKLRLTNQSRYTPQAAKTASKGSGTRKPWDAE